MGLRLEIVSQHRQGLGEIKAMDFGQDGGTIGRSLKCDWALPDRARFLSARHAAIDYRSGSYYIVDTSTNGVYVNESETPVGRGKPQRIFDGDRVRIGEYIMLARIEEDGSLTDPLDTSNHKDPVDLAERVDSPEPTGYDLIGEHEITGVGIEIVLDDDSARFEASSTIALQEVGVEKRAQPLLDDEIDSFDLELEAAVEEAEKKGTHPAAASPARAAAAAPARVAPAAAAAAARQSAPAATRPATSSTSARNPQIGKDGADATAGLEAFFRGAGLAEQNLSEAEARTTLFVVGQLVRELLTGLAENLHLRSQQKSKLRLSNTTIQKLNNNPLKFSAGADEALTNLLFKESKEYLGPVEAVRDAYAGINSHQRSFLQAMEQAVNGYVSRLAPDTLEEKFTRALSKRVSGDDAKLRYWELYREMFQALAQHAPDQLPAQFLEEFANAYESENKKTASSADQPSRKAG